MKQQPTHYMHNFSTPVPHSTHSKMKREHLTLHAQWEQHEDKRAASIATQLQGLHAPRTVGVPGHTTHSTHSVRCKQCIRHKQQAQRHPTHRGSSVTSTYSMHSVTSRASDTSSRHSKDTQKGLNKRMLQSMLPQFLTHLNLIPDRNAELVTSPSQDFAQGRVPAKVWEFVEARTSLA